MTTMEIYAQNGKAVNLRQSPSTTAARVSQLPVGTQVSVMNLGDGWAQVTTGALTGWVMRDYLRETTPSLEARVAALEARVTALEEEEGNA